MSTGSMDSDEFKKFCNGSTQVTRLYHDNIVDLKLRCFLVMMGNDLFSVKIDSGTTRRINVLKTQAEFVDNEKDVNVKKNIFKKNEDLMTNIKSNINYKLAFVDIMLKYCLNWVKGDIVPLSKNFIDAKQELLSLSDNVCDFMEACLVPSNEQEDRIAKEDMITKYKKYYNGNCPINPRQLCGAILDKKGANFPRLVYAGTERAHRQQTKGCYKYVKFKDDDDDDEDHSDYDDSNKSNKTKTNDDTTILEKKIKTLEQQIMNINLKSYNDNKKHEKEMEQYIHDRHINEAICQKAKDLEYNNNILKQKVEELENVISKLTSNNEKITTELEYYRSKYAKQEHEELMKDTKSKYKTSKVLKTLKSIENDSQQHLSRSARSQPRGDEDYVDNNDSDDNESDEDDNDSEDENDSDENDSDENETEIENDKEVSNSIDPNLISLCDILMQEVFK
jgi:hypothetical protein